MIRYRKSSLSPWINGRAQGLISFKRSLLSDYRLDPVAQELRVEADLQRLAAESHRQRLPGLADVLSLRRDGQLSVGEAEPQRRVALCHHRDSANDVQQLVARQRELVVERSPG